MRNKKNPFKRVPSSGADAPRTVPALAHPSGAAASGAETGQADEKESADGPGEEDGEFEVRAVTAHRNGTSGKREYRVSWEGYPNKEDDTWEPEENIKANAGEKVGEYLRGLEEDSSDPSRAPSAAATPATETPTDAAPAPVRRAAASQPAAAAAAAVDSEGVRVEHATGEGSRRTGLDGRSRDTAVVIDDDDDASQPSPSKRLRAERG